MWWISDVKALENKVLALKKSLESECDGIKVMAESYRWAEVNGGILA